MTPRVAIIGTGWAEKVQLPAFVAAGLSVVAIAGRNQQKTARIAREHNVPFATDDWQALLAHDCELISVTTPPHLHRAQAVAVLEAGKHLLCEKPLALDAHEAEAMLEVARAHPGQLALVDHELRFLPARRKAKELLAAGAIGRVLTVTARVSSNMRTDPDQPWNWWSDAEAGGGILGAIGSHVLDGIRWLLEDLCGPLRVRGGALGQTYVERRDAEGVLRPVTADDIASATLTIGEVVGTMLVHGAALNEPVDLLTIRGDEGTLALDRSLKLYLGKRDGVLKEYVTNLPGSVPNRFRANPYAAGTVLMAQALKDALVNHTPLHTPLPHAATLEDGLIVQQLIDDIRARAQAD